MKSFLEYISERLIVKYKKGRKLVATRGTKKGQTGTVVSMGPGAAFVRIKLDDGDRIIQQNPKFWQVVK
tara:strand:+ start:799 stop:1005 length:207 start_codon:yes stop_codon:yes gene_type:complete